MDQQLRVTDLIPIRIRSVAFLFFLGLAAIAALEWLYAWMPTVAAHTTDGRVAAFDLDGEGSLGAWFSSVVLGLAGLVSLLVYSLRRHRIDDYRGRYRIWLMAALCWFTMSVDEAGSLHEGFKELMVYLTGNRLLGDGSIWWILGYGAVLGYVGLRLVIDMRECASSLVALTITAACFCVAITAQLDWLLPESGACAVMLEEGGEMLGDLFLLLAMTLHARYIIRDIQGLIAQRDQGKHNREGVKA